MAKKPKQTGPQQFTTIPQAQQLTIPQALQLAGNQIDHGQLPQAETLLRQILQQQPRQADAVHLLGLIAHKAGKLELAIHLVGEAISINPDVAHFHANLAEMYRMHKQLDQAIHHGELAVKLDPRSANAHSNLGIAYYDQKDYGKAEACQLKALELSPNLIPALNNLGSIKRDLKDKEHALEYYHRALAIAPDYLETMSNIGAVLTELDRPEEAVQILRNVISKRPDFADAHCNIGNAFLLLEDLDKALFAFNQTLALSPDNAMALSGLAKTLMEKDMLTEARAAMDRALALMPEKAPVYSLSGDIHTKMGAYHEAEADYRSALSLDDTSLGAHLGLGQLEMELGHLDAAQAHFARAMEIDPEEITPHVSMAHVKKVRPGDETLKRLEAEAGNIETMPPTRAISLHFSLGKAYDDLKDYDRAFTHFAAGCSLKRARIQYDADNQDQAVQNICDFFTRKNIDHLKGAGDPSDVPIFVLGMPRSGTTLIETIIASHPEVHGAGELRDLLAIANQPTEGMQSPGYPLSMHGLTQDDFSRMGARYVAALRKHSATAKHITDKMPANFLALGMIHLMLPNARIIHVKRNAADACLSGFTKLFNNSQNHSYDLKEMGRYYVNYAKIMEHWRHVLPESAFLDVEYETLVADKEAQTRRIIEFCGLEWNDACLEHHKTNRSVKTASVTQVRQPVYTSSVERWRHYEKQLQPLLETLGKYAPVG